MIVAPECLIYGKPVSINAKRRAENAKQRAEEVRANDLLEWRAMENPEFESEIVRLAYERHQNSIDETARFLKRYSDTSETASDSRRDPRFPRHSICTKIRVTPCGSSFSPMGPAETGFTQNLSAGGASIILPGPPASDVLRIEFPNNLVPYTLILRLFWKLPAGNLTEGGGAFIGRL